MSAARLPHSEPSLTVVTSLDSMKDVSEGLTALHPLSKLLVVRGPPATILPALWKKWGITDIVW